MVLGLLGSSKLGLVGSTGGGFSPLDLNPDLWYDMSDTSSITDSGGAVSQVDDKSGNNYHATQGTGSLQPTTNSRTVNSLNVLDFDGGDQLIVNTGIIPSFQTAVTVFIVYQFDNVFGDDPQCLWLGQQANTGIRQEVCLGSTTYNVQNRATSNSPTNTSYTPDTSTHVVGYRRSGTNITPFLDGVEATAGTNAEDATTISQVHIGSDNAATGRRYDGAFCEVLILPSLTDADFNQLGNYAADKWGFTWTDV